MRYLVILFGIVVIITSVRANQPTNVVEDQPKVIQGPGPNAVIIAKRNLVLGHDVVTLISIHGCEYIFYRNHTSVQMAHFAGCQGLTHK